MVVTDVVAELVIVDVALDVADVVCELVMVVV